MLTRRHVRIKVMQTLYAHNFNGADDPKTLKAFLKSSIQKTFELHLLLLALLRAFRRHAQEQYLLKKQQQRFVENPTALGLPLLQHELLVQLQEDEQLSKLLKRQYHKFWDLKFDYIHQLYNALIESPLYAEYTQLSSPSLVQQRQFLVEFYKTQIAPTDTLYEALEEHQLTWTDDFPLVNTFLLKYFKQLTPGRSAPLPLLAEFKEEVQFATALLHQALLHQEDIAATVEGKTPNWESDRIAEMDKMLLHLAITELLHFPQIPPKVTLNEYLEIAKDYSTPKSNIFINGVLDKLAKEFEASGQMVKQGRGLK